MANIITQTDIKKQRYLPHDFNTKFYAVKLYRGGHSIRFVCRRYKISKASLMRWNNKFNGSKESLIDKSHKPHTPHPNSHTEEELTWIKNYIRRNPTISMSELYGKLRVNRGYSRHACSLFRVLRKLGYFDSKAKKYKKYVPQPYHTPEVIGTKFQLDVKYVPKGCYVGEFENRFYQYTIIDETSRERFIYHYREQSSHSTVEFVKRAILYFGYTPKIIQTDNGAEFTHIMKTDRVHPFDVLCNELGVHHKLIRPRTPRHNGKVERSHRNDGERFYRYLNFYSIDDLRKQAKAYLKRSNNIPMSVLGWISPIENRKKLLKNI